MNITGPTRSRLCRIAAVLAIPAIGALRAREWHGHPRGFAALAGAAMLVMLLFSGEGSGDLSAPQLVASPPDWLRRWTIAASYAAVTPAFLAAALAGHWYARTGPDATPAAVTTASTTSGSTP